MIEIGEGQSYKKAGLSISRSTDWNITHCDTAVSTDHGDNNVFGKRKIADNFGDKGRSPDDIQGSNTKETTKNKLDAGMT